MSLKKQIPNLLTLGNLFCGTLAAIFAVKGQFDTAALFVVIGISFFDHDPSGRCIRSCSDFIEEGVTECSH